MQAFKTCLDTQQLLPPLDKYDFLRRQMKGWTLCIGLLKVQYYHHNSWMQKEFRKWSICSYSTFRSLPPSWCTERHYSRAMYFQICYLQAIFPTASFLSFVIVL